MTVPPPLRDALGRASIFADLDEAGIFEILGQALESSGGNRSATAQLLELPRQTLQSRLRKLGRL